MRDPRDYKVEIDGMTPEDTTAKARPFLSVQFACCSVYQRIYKNAEGTAYVGRCPKCGKPVKFPVGEGGTDCRTFIVH